MSVSAAELMSQEMAVPVMNILVFTIILLLFVEVNSVSAHGTYFLEELCGKNIVIDLNKQSKYSVQLSRKENSTRSERRPSSCHGLLNFRWPNYQELWVTVKVRNLSLVSDYGMLEHGGCNAVQSLQLISHDGVRSLNGLSEFSMRFISDVRLKYFRIGPNGTDSTIDMSIEIEPFNITAKSEYFNQWNYQNVSLEEYCGRNMIENVTDGTIRWSLNVAASSFEEAPDAQCFTVLSFDTYSEEKLQNLSYFVHVHVHESHLREEMIPSHGCLVEQQIVLRGPGWIHTFDPRLRSSVLMRHSGWTSLGYFRRKPFDEKFTKFNIIIRVNEGDEYITDIPYDEENNDGR